MSTKRVLLMHISKISGHRCASVAIENALGQLDGNVQVHSIDAFNYTNPILEKFINGLYMFVIKAMPRVWEYLYDNEGVFKKARKTRALIYRISDKKIEKLFADFKPDIVVCTQAYPCAMLADYKHRHNLDIPLIGVLTDYAPHIYWLDELVDIYVIPAAQIKQRLIARGIAGERLEILGIPVDAKFRNQSNREEILRRLALDAELPIILIMGGGQGLGPIKKIVRTLDKLTYSVQLMVVCGTNKRLYRWFEKNKTNFSKPLSIFGYTDQVNDLMAISSFIVSKPGGLTSAEALSKSLPMIVFRPLPGQESQNTQFLLETEVALKVNSYTELRCLAEELLTDTVKLEQLRKKATTLARADSALKIAQLILNVAE